MKKVMAVLFALVLSRDVSAADGCPLGFTKRAVKEFGGATYITPCKIARCVPVGTRASLFTLFCPIIGACFNVYTYQYVASWGTAPAATCRSEVSNDVWSF